MISSEFPALWENAAAHRALYGPFAFTIRQAELYEGQAAEIAQLRTWNDAEIVVLTVRSKREAKNIIKRNRDRWRDRTFKMIVQVSDLEIDKYMREVLERNQK